MQVNIQARGFEQTEALRAYVEKRLQFALIRFEDRIVRVAVCLSDVNGPKGGVDKNCHIQVRLNGLPDIVVKDTEADLYVAVDRAAERVGRTLGRYLRRARGTFDARYDWSEEVRVD